MNQSLGKVSTLLCYLKVKIFDLKSLKQIWVCQNICKEEERNRPACQTAISSWDKKLCSYTTQLEHHGVSADFKERKNNRNKQQQNKQKKPQPPAAIFHLKSGMGTFSLSTL